MSQGQDVLFLLKLEGERTFSSIQRTLQKANGSLSERFDMKYYPETCARDSAYDMQRITCTMQSNDF